MSKIETNRSNLPKILNIFLNKFENEFGNFDFYFNITEPIENSSLVISPRLDISKWMKNEYYGHPKNFINHFSKLFGIPYNIFLTDIQYYGGENELKDLMSGLNECIKNNNYYKEWINKIYLIQNKESGKPIVKVNFYTEADLNITSNIILELIDCRNNMGYMRPGIIDMT